MLAGVAGPRRRARWPAVLGTACAAAAALVLVLLSREDPDRDGFAPRGQGAASAELALVCDGGCRRGDTVVLDLGATAGFRYLSVFARGPGGQVTWYVDAADLETRLRDGIFDRKIALAAGQPPGRYDIYGIFSDEPLTREAIRARFTPGAADIGPGTAVITRELEVR